MKKILLAMAAFGILTFQAAAQLSATYTFSQANGTYTPIVGGTVLQTGAALNTDAVFTNIPLGFNFRFNNRIYTEINISNNGFIWFGKAQSDQRQGWSPTIVPAVTLSTPISSTTTPSGQDGFVAGFGSILSAAAAGAPEIRHELLGTPGNFVFVVQYTDVRSSTADASMRLTFQIVLSESNNSAGIVYGPCTAPSANRTGQVGIRGANQQDFSNRTTTGAWTATTAGTLATNTCLFSTTNIPASGLTFMWTPGAPPVAPVYSALGTLQDFDAIWGTYVSPNDVPNNNWSAWSGWGNNTWRRDDNTLAGWTSTGFGGFVIAAPASGRAARFHSYDARATQVGNLDFYVDFSSSPNAKELKFDYINGNSGTDTLKVMLSTDGGVTFGAPLAALTLSANWTSQTVALGTSLSPTCVVRFSAVGNFGINAEDIGIDNVQVNALASLDMGVSSLFAPVPTNCLGSSETVSVNIRNYGGATIDFSVNPVTVSSSVTGPNPQTFTPVVINTGTLAPNTTQVVVITTTYNMSAAGTYTFNANTTVTGDGSAANDAMPATNIVNSTVTVFPYTQDFETFTPATNATGYTAGWSTIPTNTTSLYRWNVQAGNTPSSPTGPSVDHTTGTGTGRYIFTEASNGVTNDIATVISPCFDFTSMPNPGMDYWYHMCGTNINRLVVDVYNGSTWVPVDSIVGPVQTAETDAWQKRTVNLTAFSGSIVKIRFRGVRGTSFLGDMAVDDVRIYNLPLLDMGANALTAPIVSNGCYTANETVSVLIQNKSFFTIDFSVNPVTINASVAGPNPMTFTPVVLNSGTLASNATQTVVITTTYDMTLAGTYTFDANAVVTGDGDVTNDAMAQVMRTSTVPSVTASGTATICDGDSTALTSSGTAFGSVVTEFVQSTDLVVPDLSTVTSVNAVTTSLNANQITFVTLDTLYHTFDSDLDISLIAPDGSFIDLTSDNGGAGQNYIETVFSTSGPSITTGVAPFTGTFQPEQPFSLFTGSANGNWTLQITDDVGGDVGLLERWTLTFMQPNTITSYSWAPAAGLSSTTVQNPMAAPTVTTTYTVTVTDGNGCTKTATVTVAVNPSPVVSLGADVTQCGGTVLLDAGNPGETYSWSDGSTNQTLSASASGTYFVIVTNSFGCSKTDTVNITINPIPVVALGADQTVCATTTLDAQNPGSTYAWSTAETTQMITVTSTGTYSVLVTDGNGCSNSDTINVTVNPLPVVALGADVTQCAGTVLLDAGNVGATYLWSESSTTQTITVSASGTYSVVVTDANGCSNSDTINVTINTLPVVALGPDQTQCGDTVLLDAGNPGASYLWSDASTAQTLSVTTTGTYSVIVTDGNGCSNADTVNVTINLVPVQALGPDITQCGDTVTLDAQNAGSSYTWNTGDTTQMIMTDTSGTFIVNMTSPQGCVNSDTIVVTINAVPVVDAGTDTSICFGNSVTLMADSGYTSYLWEYDTFSSTSQSITVTPGATTTYTLTVSNAAGCTASDIVTVAVDVPPSPSFTHVVTGGNTVTFTNTTTGSSPITFVWDFGDGSPTSTLANPVHTYTANGTYTVILTASNACGTYSITQTVTITGIGYEELSMEGSFNMYPNPSQGNVNISVSIDLEQLEIEIYSVDGKRVFSSLDRNVSSGFVKHLNLNDISNGMYSVKINTGNAIRTGKLIISK